MRIIIASSPPETTGGEAALSKFKISDFAFEMQDSSNLKIISRWATALIRFLISLLLILHLSAPASAQSPVSWTFAGPPGYRDRITALAVDPRNDSVIYVGTPGGG